MLFVIYILFSIYYSEDHSSIQGVLTKGGHFEGKIVTQNETYFMERTVHHFQHTDEFHTLVYRISDVTFNASRASCAHAQLKEKQKQMTRSRDSNNYAKYEHDRKDDTVTSPVEETRKYSKELNMKNLEDATIHYKRAKREVDPTKRICELYMQV